MIKQFVIARADLGLRKGALGAQIAHSATMWLAWRLDKKESVPGFPSTSFVTLMTGEGELSGKFSGDEIQWLGRPSTLIILRAETKEQFLDIARQLAEAGIEHHIWTEEDLGDEPTCLATPPIDEAIMKPITGSLKLLQ